MEANNIQQVLFQHIKSRIPSHLSFVDEIANILEISNDSAYRRIRGEKPLSLEETEKLCKHFHVSLDQMLNLKSDTFIFNGRITNSSDFTFENWLGLVIKHLEMITSYSPNHLSYVAKEIPFYYYYLMPEIAAFKSFFFMKSILYYEDWRNAKFSVKDDYSKFAEYTNRISKLFASIPSTEIWSIENITSTIHQIEFYHVTGVLRSTDDAVILMDKLEELVNHLERQAEYGVKLRYGQNPDTATASYKMFVNELIMGDNMQLIQIGNTQVTYINHSVLNFISTHDAAFNAYMKKTFEVLTQKSTIISEVNEKERLLFFNRLRAKIKTAKQQLHSVTY